MLNADIVTQWLPRECDRCHVEGRGRDSGSNTFEREATRGGREWRTKQRPRRSGGAFDLADAWQDCQSTRVQVWPPQNIPPKAQPCTRSVVEPISTIVEVIGAAGVRIENPAGPFQVPGRLHVDQHLLTVLVRLRLHRVAAEIGAALLDADLAFLLFGQPDAERRIGIAGCGSGHGSGRLRPLHGNGHRRRNGGHRGRCRRGRWTWRNSFLRGLRRRRGRSWWRRHRRGVGRGVVSSGGRGLRQSVRRRGRRWRRGRGCGCVDRLLRLGLRIDLCLLRRLLLFVRRVLIGVRPLRFTPGIVVNAGNRNSTTVGIDPNGMAAILETVLGLRGAAGEQKCGNSQ